MNIQPFNFNGNNLSVIINENNDPLFIAKEVCEILKHTNSRKAIADLCDPDDVTTGYIPHPQSQTKQLAVNIINESALYQLIFGSRLESAKQFKKWVTSEVLPSIRKHGAYMTSQKIEEVLLNPDTLIQLATNLKAEQEKVREQKQLLDQQKPLVVFAEALQISDHCILIGELAKILKQNGYDIGQNRLFSLLRENKYLMSRGEQFNLPTQRSLDLGLFEVKTTTINNPDGSIRVSKTTKVTPKGQKYFINKFIDNKNAA